MWRFLISIFVIPRLKIAAPERKPRNRSSPQAILSAYAAFLTIINTRVMKKVVKMCMNYKQIVYFCTSMKRKEASCNPICFFYRLSVAGSVQRGVVNKKSPANRHTGLFLTGLCLSLNGSRRCCGRQFGCRFFFIGTCFGAGISALHQRVVSGQYLTQLVDER